MIGYYSYLSAAIGFGFLTILLLFSWRSSTQGRLLTLVVICTTVWAVLAMLFARDDSNQLGGYQLFEVLRYVAWYVFLLKLFEPAAQRIVGHAFLRRFALFLFTGAALVTGLMELAVLHWLDHMQAYQLMTPKLMGHLLLAILGVALIEQLYRNISTKGRQAMKYLLIGAGAIFAFDFYMYANALLFLGIDRELWEARGLITLLAVPLLTLSAARNKDWSPNIFVSRDIVLYSTTIIASGLYLLIMAAAGYYLQEYGGSWGRVAKVVFLSLAAVFLATVLFSGQLRRQLRVFLGKHFYRNKYDYRREWLSLTAALNMAGRDSGSYEAAIEVLAQPVDARAGLLWLKDERGDYRNVAAWGAMRVEPHEPSGSEFARYLETRSYIINLLEVESRPGEYEELVLPQWLSGVDHAWLILPLPGPDSLLGFVVLARPLLVREVNWEDRDLLKTAAQQVASHLAVVLTADALAQAKQFEVFNRLSSYMVHDLKNVAAGLEMVAKNAARHRDNPAFLDDAFDSVSASASDIRRLLGQLRNKHMQAGKSVLIDLKPLLEDVARSKALTEPAPRLQDVADGCLVTAEKERLGSVLTHLVDNAQQATAVDGSVMLRLFRQDGTCVIEIEDDGEGMDDEFIEQRLFKPFDTTKGNAGMGIGMYESREFIRQLGGEIQVSSEPGKGTLISLCFPEHGGGDATPE
jgi:putative PEP-CTERM system histidine kinase